MKKNWIVIVLALVALASCSVEKRVYQPGYHIEWNHYAKQDAQRDASQDVAQDAERDASQDVAQDAERDASQDVSQGAERNASQDVSQDAERNASQDVSQDAERNASQDVSQDAQRDVSQDVAQDAQRDVSQDVAQDTERDASQAMGQSIDSGLELILFIILAIFLPALTIFLLEGFSKNFWLALLLMILAFALQLPLFLKGMIQLIAVIVAIAVVFHYF
jgi:uncharacterized membrane protein YqaE (UPF0057 family)